MYHFKRTLTLGLVVVFGYLSSNNTSGPAKFIAAGGRTGAPFNNNLTCSSTAGCHTSAGAFTPVTTVELLDGTTAVTTYQSSKSYTLRIKMTSTTGITSSTKYSFQVTCAQTSSGNDINTWGSSMPSGVHKWATGGRNYVEHSYGLTTNTINIPWTSPNTSTGNVTFYCAGQIVNGNFQESGDNVHATSLTVTPSGACTAPTIAATSTDVKCKGDSSGAISLNVTGGTAPYIFTWSGPGNFQSASQNVNKLVAGNYKVVVTATGGCKDSTTVTIYEPTGKVAASASSSSPYCVGNAITINGNGSPSVGGPLTYSWVGPGSTAYLTQNILLNPAGTSMTGDYILSVTDTTGCTAMDTAHVVVNDVPHVDSVIVVSSGANSFIFTGASPMFVQSRMWSFGDGSTSNADSPMHTFTNWGQYTVRLIVSNNCGSDTVYKTIVAIPETVKQQYRSAAFSVYPSPASKYLNIKNNAAGPLGKISMYDMHGIKVLERKNIPGKDIRIETAHLATGSYMLHIATGNETAIIRVIILN